jgi:hypothetical protein
LKRIDLTYPLLEEREMEENVAEMPLAPKGVKGEELSEDLKPTMFSAP